jgi:PEP-CTERM motif
MRTMRSALFAVGCVVALSSGPVLAGSTCKLVPSWCPPAPSGGSGPSTVPEPESLTILAVGAFAVGIAARRRRKK